MPDNNASSETTAQAVGWSGRLSDAPCEACGDPWQTWCPGCAGCSCNPTGHGPDCPRDTTTTPEESTR